jgi:hemolysin-activating ACP:hemolysin acyltransferase
VLLASWPSSGLRRPVKLLLEQANLYWHALGQTLSAASSSDTPTGRWLHDFAEGWRSKLEWHAWDRYGRWLGRIRWQQQGNALVLVDLQAPSGALWRLRRALHSRLRALGSTPLQLRERARRADQVLRALPLPEPSAPLHPVLAGMADEHTAQQVELAQAFTLLARNPRHGDLPLSTLLRRIRRAQGAGQLRIWLDAAGEPQALLIWARPSEASREALCSGDVPALHAAQWNEGGPVVLLDFCARDAAAAALLADALPTIANSADDALYLRLGQGTQQAGLLRIPRPEWPSMQAWLQSALAAEATVT